MGKKSASLPASVQTDDSIPPSPNQTSLKDLLLAGKAQTCAYSDKLEGSDISGKSYITNGKMRNDIDSKVNDKTMSTHMIMDGNTSFTWVDGQKTGFKMTVNPKDFEKDESDTETANPPNGGQSVDINKVIDYKCKNWKADNSFFVPPPDIQFTDFSSVMKPKSVTASDPQSANPCGACDNLPDEAKQGCRTALKCD